MDVYNSSMWEYVINMLYEAVCMPVMFYCCCSYKSGGKSKKNNIDDNNSLGNLYMNIQP